MKSSAVVELEQVPELTSDILRPSPLQQYSVSPLGASAVQGADVEPATQSWSAWDS